MGSGKTSVGKVLAKRLAVPFKDLDREIEKREGLTISEIFDQKGEIHFRKAENRTLKTLLKKPDDFVLATGGGTPCYANSLLEMLEAEEALTVYLKTSVPMLSERLFSQREHRPLLRHLNTLEALQEFVGIHLFERSHFYNQAGLVVDTGKDSPGQIAERIIPKLF